MKKMITFFLQWNIFKLVALKCILFNSYDLGDGILSKCNRITVYVCLFVCERKSKQIGKCCDLLEHLVVDVHL